MFFAGIDVGLENIKIVILDGEKIISKEIGSSGGANRSRSVDEIYENALTKAKINREDIARAVSTGQGKYDVTFADKTITDSIAAARAAKYYDARASVVIDAGADQTRVVALGDDEIIKNVTANQKCMAGLGLLISVIADRTGMSLEEIASLPPDAGDGVLINDGCPVFAEQGAIELLLNGIEREKVAGAIINMVSIRLHSMINEKIAPDISDVILIGGVAKNGSLITALQSRSGIDFFIPEDAEYGGALGAAVVAAGMSEYSEYNIGV